MARTEEISANHSVQRDESGDKSVDILRADGGSDVVVVGNAFIQTADYTKQGNDLLLTGSDGHQVLIQDYFNGDNPPDLVSDGGARVTGDIAVLLAGPEAAGQYAQASAPASGAPVIGKIAEISGNVTLTKADGSVVVAQDDALIHQGDRIETGAGAKLGIIFIDKTTFAIGENARMVLNEMIYDPAGGQLSSVVTLLHGAFLFVTGEIGKLFPEAVVVNTPVATIGVRGTETSALIDQIAETLQVASERGPNEGVVTVTINNVTYELTPGSAATNITPLTTLINTFIGSLKSDAAIGGFGLPELLTGAAEADQYRDLRRQQNDQQDEQTPNDSGEATPEQEARAAALGQSVDPAAGSTESPDITSPEFRIATESPLGLTAPPPQPFNPLVNTGPTGAGGRGGSGPGASNGNNPDLDRDDPPQTAGTIDEGTLVAEINGTPGNDTLVSTPDDEIINGGPGDDTIIWNDGGGNDTINGGPGNDKLIINGNGAISNLWQATATGPGLSLVSLVQFNVALALTTLNLDGIETIEFNAGDGGDVVTFGPLATTDVSNTTLIFNGGASNDVLDGRLTDRSINADGAGGNDILIGGSQDDTLLGGAGDDILTGGAGDDTLNGGGGNDTVSYAVQTGDINVDLSSATDQATGAGIGTDQVIQVENVFGGAGNDTLIGDAMDNLLVGGDGDDLLDGRDGADILSGGAGEDTLIGGAGDDILIGGTGGRYDDDLDLADYSGAAGPIIVNIATGDAAFSVSTVIGDGFDIVRSVEAFRGTAGDDTFTVADGFFSGSGGIWLGSEDRFIGNATVTIEGGDGNDTIDGNRSTVASYRHADDSVTVTLAVDGSGTAQSTSGTVADTANVGLDTFTDGVSGIIGSAFGDTLTGEGGGVSTQRFYGLAGDDVIDGGVGSTRGTAEHRYDISGVTVDLAAGTAIDGWGDTDTLINIDRAYGSAFDDSLTGNSDGNWLRGRQGNDFIDGAGGHDSADYRDDIDDGVFISDGLGGLINGIFVDLSGAENLNASAPGTAAAIDGWGNIDMLISIEGVRGSLFDDRIIGDAAINSIFGLQGDDNLDGGGSNFDTVNYIRDIDDGNDILNSQGVAVNGVIVNLTTGMATDGWGNTDILANFERISGSSFDDELIGDSGNNQLRGFDGSDRLIGNGGLDMVSYRSDIDDGNDISDGAGNLIDGVFVDLFSGLAIDGWGNFDTLVDIEQVQGSAFDDVLIGDSGNNLLWGRAGDDILDGLGGAFDEVAYFDDIDDGNDIDDGSGTLINGVLVNLETGTATDGWGGTDTLLNVERVFGSQFDDHITGDNANNNSLDGEQGNDTLSGLDGDDALWGEEGNDVLIGGRGHDFLNGGAGTDTADYSSDTASVTVDLSGQDTGPNFVGTATDGAGFTDTLTSIENIIGSGFADVLTGDSQDNVFLGGLGSDTIDGGAGSDTLLYTNTADGFERATNGVVGFSGHGDLINNFQSGTDTLEFTQGDFNLNALFIAEGENFSIIAAAYDGTNAGTNSEHDAGNGSFIYSTADKTLYHDADGAAEGYTVIATVQSGDNIAAGDITITL